MIISKLVSVADAVLITKSITINTATAAPWRLAIADKIPVLVEGDPISKTEAIWPLYEFTTRDAAIKKIAELGLTLPEDGYVAPVVKEDISIIKAVK